MISWSPVLYPFRPNQFATLEHSRKDMIAFTRLQTCWSLLWDQFRSVWKCQSKALRWALSSLTCRDPRSLWSQSAEENSTTDGRSQESLGKRSHMAAGAGEVCQHHWLHGSIDLLEIEEDVVAQRASMPRYAKLLLPPPQVGSSSTGVMADSGPSGLDQSNKGLKFRNIWISHRYNWPGQAGFFCFHGDKTRKCQYINIIFH